MVLVVVVAAAAVVVVVVVMVVVVFFSFGSHDCCGTCGVWRFGLWFVVFPCN